MLVSEAVSENSIPAIAKTVEVYLIGNEMDRIINHPDFEQKTNLNYKIKGGEIVAEQGGPPGATSGTKKRSPQSPASPPTPAEKDTEEKDKKATAKITVSDYKSISLEPTTITINVKDQPYRHIGIKVLPLRVESDVRLSHLILYDYHLNYFNAKIVSIGRSVMRFIWRMTDRWAKKLRIGELTPTGDPRKDVLMGRSGHKGPAFIVLNKSEDIDDVFLKNYKKLRRLSKMGWGNFIIADDINRIAYFCMEEFKGVCNVISYEMMYNKLGQLKVYESLEDAKKKSNSLFKVRQRFSKVIGEWIANDKLSKYSNLQERIK
jgi:hypothetical protein